MPQSASVGFKDEIARDDNANGEARPDGQRRCDLQLAPDDLLTGVVDGVLCAVADSADQAVLIADRQFRADREQRGETGRFGEIPPVIIDPILETSVSLRVGARLAFEDDGAAVREDQPVLDQQRPSLPELHVVVVLADNPRALRDQKQSAGRTVVDVFRHLRSDLARQIGANAGDERG